MAGRNTEERIALINEKIAKKQSEIEALEAQKQKLLHPVTMKTVMAKAKESGLSPEEIAEKLGIEV
jgi:cell division protein FtsL